MNPLAINLVKLLTFACQSFQVERHLDLTHKKQQESSLGVAGKEQTVLAIESSDFYDHQILFSLGCNYFKSLLRSNSVKVH